MAILYRKQGLLCDKKLVSTIFSKTPLSNEMPGIRLILHTFLHNGILAKVQSTTDIILDRIDGFIPVMVENIVNCLVKYLSVKP